MIAWFFPFIGILLLYGASILTRYLNQNQLTPQTLSYRLLPFHLLSDIQITQSLNTLLPAVQAHPQWLVVCSLGNDNGRQQKRRASTPPNEARK